jgi:hypothetical protein
MTHPLQQEDLIRSISFIPREKLPRHTFPGNYSQSTRGEVWFMVYVGPLQNVIQCLQVDSQ